MLCWLAQINKNVVQVNVRPCKWDVLRPIELECYACEIFALYLSLCATFAGRSFHCQQQGVGLHHFGQLRRVEGYSCYPNPSHRAWLLIPIRAMGVTTDGGGWKCAAGLRTALLTRFFRERPHFQGQMVWKKCEEFCVRLHWLDCMIPEPGCSSTKDSTLLNRKCSILC